ncbi:MAG: DUF1631 domain-containing protein [Gammaproteobacteria bacterium]|nr:DUF1631 domain-containing protein [Gammaproteobacteria bacterium]
MSADIYNFKNSKHPGFITTDTDPEYASQIINDFIRNSSESSNSAMRATGSKHLFNRQDVLKALSSLQLTYKAEFIPGQKVNINTDNFKSALINSMAKLNNVAVPKTMNQIDSRTVDFVEMIFGAFLRDKNISNAIKTLLLKLQIPVIKTSLLDTNFFYNDKHPARNVLDTIAHIGIGIDTKENTVYQTMELIIDQLLRGFDQNIISFHTALSSLNRLTVIEKEKLDQNEKITRKNIIKEHARQIVLTQLQYHTMKKPIPKPVQPLILKYWSTLMFHTYIRNGKDSKEWNEAVGILKLLTNTLHSIKEKNEWWSLKTTYKEIVYTVSEKLNSTKQCKEKMFMAVRNLERIYETILEKSGFTEDDDESFEVIETEAGLTFIDNEPCPIATKAAAAKEKINRLPPEVKPNAWFEIYTGEDSTVRRLKLSVIIQENAKLIFVDRLGVKVIEKDADTFAAELAANQSFFLADHSIFNHALSQVITSIAASR